MSNSWVVFAPVLWPQSMTTGGSLLPIILLVYLQPLGMFYSVRRISVDLQNRAGKLSRTTSIGEMPPNEQLN